MYPVSAICNDLSSPNLTNFGISLLILLGILLSYLPQHHRIISRRSSFGLSPYFVLLGTTSGTCQFANILVLPRSRADIACCKEVSGFACFAGLLGIAQVGVQWSCFAIILLLFLIFFPRATPPSPDPAIEPERPSVRTALVVTVICLIHGIITFILSLYFVVVYPHALQSWADLLGIFSTVLASIQYLPQIYTTFTLKKVGSLSIPMMCIQTPGSFVWAASLSARLGMEGWSAWGVYVVTGCLQGCLLVMGIYFELIERKRRKAEDLDAGSRPSDPANGTLENDGRPSEQSPLLRAG